MSKEDRQQSHIVRLIRQKSEKQRKRMVLINKFMLRKGLAQNLLVSLHPSTCCFRRMAVIVDHTNIAGGSVVSIGACRRCAKHEVDYFTNNNKWPVGDKNPPLCKSTCNKKLLILPYEIETSPCVKKLELTQRIATDSGRLPRNPNRPVMRQNIDRPRRNRDEG